jgi:hypothetical protein
MPITGTPGDINEFIETHFLLFRHCTAKEMIHWYDSMFHVESQKGTSAMSSTFTFLKESDGATFTCGTIEIIGQPHIES